MRRIDFRPWAGLILSVAVLGYVGCTSSSSSGPEAGAPAAGKTGGAAGSPATADPAGGSDSKLLANLGNPSAVLVVSGEMNGYLEPCGCTEGQVGGLIRRYDFFERLHKQGVKTAQIDLGSLTRDPAAARGGFEQAKMKFDHAIKALKLLDYNAVALSPEDMKVGVGEALALFVNSLGEKARIVAANVEAPAGFESMFAKSVVVPVGPVKVGVTAVVDPEAIEALNDPDKNLLTAGLKRPNDAIPAVLADLESKSDYQVLMVQGPPAMARSLAGAYPGFDIVVARSDYDDVLKQEAELLNDGKTQLIQVGRKGKFLGVFGLSPRDAKRPPYVAVNLGTRYDGPGTAMKQLIQDDYRDALRQAGVVENIPRRNYIAFNGSTGATFVGAENCKSCHRETYKKWLTTPHAHAFESLLKDKKPNVAFDAECVTCHTTGFEYETGWVSEKKTPYLAGNQCENCHGPGSKHVADPDNREFRAAMNLTPEKAEKNRVCLGCHDIDNSPHFDMTSYYPKIAHKGLDDYQDPKVHKGIAPKLAGGPPEGKAPAGR